MRKLAVTATALASMTLGALALSQPDGAPAQNPSGGFDRTSLSWLERGQSFSFTDEAPRTKRDRSGQPRRISAGDGFVSRKSVLDAQRRRIGRIEEHCTITNNGRSLARLRSVCHAVVHLRDGQLTATFSPDFGAEARSAAVTGGTGIYTGASGTIDGSESDPTVRAELIVPRR